MGNLRDEREVTVIKEYVTWKDVEDYLDAIVQHYKDLKQFTGVYGPARGGVIFAAIISNRFDLPYLGAPQVGCLIVDDICDSGNTALCWKNKGYTFTSMYYKQGALVTPDFYMKEKDDKWIVFPWEENTLNK